MGRDNHNVGLHMRPKNYKTPCDARGVWDRYAAMLGCGRITKNIAKPYDTTTTTQKIVEQNHVTIWKRKGQQRVCTCGGQLQYSDNIILCWTDAIGENQVQVSGKYCTACQRKYVVRSILLSAIKSKKE